MNGGARDEYLKAFAQALVAICVRNGYLEDLHAGTQPATKAGDYSDVKVVTPYGDIAWNEVSRIDNDQMKALMKDIVNSVYTVLLHEGDPEYLRRFLTLAQRYVRDWDEPEPAPALMKSKSTGS